MRIFKIVYSRLLDWLMPTRLRRPIHKAWLKALNVPIVYNYGLFMRNRDINLYKVKHGLHVAHLEAVLNDRWDNGFRRIKVEDAPLDYQPKMVYRTIENKPVYAYRTSENNPELLWTGDEILFGGIDFVVKVPISIVYNVEEMTQNIKYYKTPGMGFIIQDV